MDNIAPDVWQYQKRNQLLKWNVDKTKTKNQSYTFHVIPKIKITSRYKFEPEIFLKYNKPSQ